VDGTPRMTPHAALRCIEMGISTKVAKRIVRNADVRRPGGRHSDAMIATSDDDPDYAVVYYPTDPPIVITVVFRTPEVYVRRGIGFEVSEEPTTLPALDLRLACVVD
jgi:hypothetical protein